MSMAAPNLLDRKLTQRLPFDVLLELFSLCRTPLLLSQVCRLWRNVADACPMLWAHIDLLTSHFVQRAEHWIKRAGSHPLTITIRFPMDCPSDRSLRMWRHISDRERFGARVARLARILFPTMERWREFSVHGHEDEVSQLLHTCHGSTPLLRRLSISFEKDQSRSPPRQPIPFERENDFPLHVSFTHCLPCFRTPSPVALAITHATVQISFREDLFDTPCDAILRLISSCPNLSHLCLQGGRIGRTPTHRLVRHPLLTHLSVSKVPDIIHLLDLVEVPSLQSLSITDFEWSDLIVLCLTNILKTCDSLSNVELAGLHKWMTVADASIPPLDPEAAIVLPHVKRFKMMGNNVFAYPLLHNLVFPELEVLDVEGTTPEIVARLMGSLHLISATLRAIQGVSRNPITLPALESLEITYFFDILGGLRLPRLTSLTLRGVEGINVGAPFRHLFRHTTPPLTFLSMSDVRIVDEDLIWLLERLPKSRKLELRNSFISGRILRALSGSPERTSEGPRPLLDGMQRFPYLVLVSGPQAGPRASAEALKSLCLPPIKAPSLRSLSDQEPSNAEPRNS
ncbi:hypothetical protein BOTBODRAFT_172475 [Botryobasidium botryosum FD-172 SS1]|uniref:Uncharacterized protein n=1 Tax=Botryobasidium botryosum (strain FD-172 SS1) TaxID=930990 RepID=A0A067MRV5_BOTB1|nr:hypothetical protein BOTBODRAFT_172475 [Botryobasidium botryosum FD-172 SS1]